MTANVTDVDTFTDPVTVPSDGESATGASILGSVQKLSNRTKYLYNRLIKLAGFYSDGTFQLDILAVATVATAWEFLATGWLSVGNALYLAVPIGADILPHGATLTGFTVRVNPGIARATTGNRMQFEAYKISSTGTWTLIGSGTYDDGTTNAQTVTKSGLTEVIDRNSYAYALRVTSGNDGASNIDSFYAAAIVRTL